jgi:hypothetical protein
MYLNLPASKTDPFRQGVTITISHDINNIFCPVQTMIYYLSNFPPTSMLSPLFTRQDKSAFTREYIIFVLQDLAIRAGQSGHFTGHSFRCGAAFWVALQGIPESDIKSLGRWKSDAVQRYIVKPSDDKEYLAQRFARYANRLPLLIS